MPLCPSGLYRAESQTRSRAIHALLDLRKFQSRYSRSRKGQPSLRLRRSVARRPIISLPVCAVPYPDKPGKDNAERYLKESRMRADFDPDSIEFAVLLLHDETGGMLGIAAVPRYGTRRFEGVKALRRQLAASRGIG